MFDEQESDRLRQKHNHQHMSNDIKWEPRTEIRHLHRLRVLRRVKVKSHDTGISLRDRGLE